MTLTLGDYPIRPMTREQQQQWETLTLGAMEALACEVAAARYLFVLRMVKVAQAIATLMDEHPALAERVRAHARR